MNIFRKFAYLSVLLFVVQGCSDSSPTQNVNANPAVESVKDIAHDAFVYAYPMMEQVKTINGMISFMGLEPNKPAMNTALPRDNVGMPIVAPNLTSMTGGVFLDISHGPVTLEIPEVKDRYIVYQAIDVFTHNFFYMGSRANNGEGGRFTFYNSGQEVSEASDSTPVLMEGDLAIIVVRIDIKNEDDYDRVRAIQDSIKIVDKPEQSREYPIYDEEKANSPQFVEYLNTLLTEVPPTESALFERFSAIGVMSDVQLSEAQKLEVQAGIDAALEDIKTSVEELAIGNGYIGATEVFGTREYLNGNYLGRAAGAHFGLWGNSKEEANYFMSTVAGEGEIVFTKNELPPLSEIGFWSVTAHDENVHVNKNEFDRGYVITEDDMQYREDGSLVIRFSSQPEDGNWLYTDGGPLIIAIRAYQADPEKIGDYVPPAFKPDVK